MTYFRKSNIFEIDFSSEGVAHIRMRNKLLFPALFSLCAKILFGQPAASPQVINPSFRFEPNQTVLSIRAKDVDALEKKYGNKIKIIYRHSGTKSFLVLVNHKNVFDQLKSDSTILFIDSHRKPREEAGLDYINFSFNRITKAHTLLPAMNGLNQKISIKEQNFDASNIDLINRSFITSVTPSAVSQHATTMATLIAGAGNSSYHTLGVVPQANFTSSDFNNLFPDDISVFTTKQISIQNHSYGVEVENYYGNEAEAYDKQMWDHPTLLHVFSVGNSGNSATSSGTYQGLGFASLTGNFKQAKNVLVVNAVDTTLTINSLNSRGPAFDGRLKPEVTAFGQGGTSEAAALVSGIAALVQQKYFQLNGKMPDASLVKASLIATADDLGIRGIDFLYGYGSANAYKAVTLIDQGNYFETSLPSNAQTSIPISIPASTGSIKIAIAWTDAPAVVNASTALVNDIDASLEGATVTYPWVLNSYPHVDSLMSSAKRKPDHLNNIEYITLENPAAGTYQIKINSNTLSTSAQKISVAYWIEPLKKFEWDFPSQSDRVESSKKNLLVWQAAPGQVGDLFLQINQGAWTLMKASVNLDRYSFATFPDTLANARLKMVMGADEFISDSFIISPLLKLKTAFNCADSLGLSWNLLKGATGYNIYTMGSAYLQNVATTTDTTLVLNKSSDKYFSVAPLLNGAEGFKSETIDYSQQGAFCFINLFSALRFSAKQIKVQLTISSWIHIDHITVFKTVRGSKNVFQTSTSKNQLAFEFMDDQLIPGIMTYQAEIVFKNGSKILSDAVDIPIEEKGRAILYPNPVTSESDLNIISEGNGLTFRLLDVYGRIIMEAELDLVLDSVDVLQLPTGLYIYQLLNANEISDSGRIIKY